ncbi:unnamed protein product [Victoria cruziana]
MLIRRSPRFLFPLKTARLCRTGRSDDLPADARDVSRVVHRIAGIVLSEDHGMPMEDSLSAAGIAIDAEIAEMVLKRCFKARGPALRFFDWVGRRPEFRHTAGTYNSMIHIAGEDRDFDMVKDLLGRMDAESVKADVNTWNIVVSHYGKAGLLGEALLAFEKMRYSLEADEATYSSLVRALCEGKKIELAVEFYREMASKGMKLDVYVYRLLMTESAGSGDLDTVRLIADDMAKIAGMTEDTVNSSLLKRFCVSGRLEEALELLREIRMKTVIIDNEKIQILVEGLCLAGRNDDALELIGEMERENVSVDKSVYEFLLDDYVKRGKVLKARELSDNWKKMGFVPSISLYTSMIQRLFWLNEYAEACNLYQDMKTNGIEPDVVAVTALVAGHIRHGNISEALEAFEDMKGKGLKPTRKAYSVFIHELCKASEIEVARKVFAEMQSCGFGVPSELSRLAMDSMEDGKLCMKRKEINQKMDAYRIRNRELRLKRADLATNSPSILEDVDGLRPFRSSDMNSNELHQLSGCSGSEPAGNECFSERDLIEVTRLLSSSCDWTEIQEALEKSEIHFSTSLVVEILRNRRRHGRAAMKFFSWVSRKPGHQQTAEAYNMAIKIAGSGKDFKYMRVLFEEMERKGCEATADTWTIMLTQYGKAGLTKMALQKFKEMKAGKCKPKGSTYKYLILFLCGRKGRNVDEAIKLFREMIRAGFTPDKELAETYIICLCETDNLTEARAFVESVCRKCFTSQIGYSMLVKALCRAGRLEEAASVVDELENLGCAIDQYIYGSLVHGLLRGGKHEDALAKVAKMKVGGMVPTVHVYTSFISYYLKTKQIEHATRILEDMRENGCAPTIITFSTLIRGYMNEGRVLDAWSVFRIMKLKGPFPDFKTYSMFIACLCKAGRSSEGLQLIQEMIETGILPSTVNFRTVFYGLNREGKSDLAHCVLQTKWALMRSRKCWP